MPSPRTTVTTALTDDGQTWPVIDITHPAFVREPTDLDLEASATTFFAEAERRARIPRFIHRLLLRIVLRKSLLGPGLLAASGGFVTGLNTYLLKLGPDNLPDGASAIDRRIAESFPAISTQLRLKDIARLLAEDLAARLVPRDGRPVVLINIAGGPAADSLNALILLRQARPELIADRRVEVRILDQDAHGPSFAARCAAVLTCGDGPLAGLDLRVTHVLYDWRQTDGLRKALDEASAARALVAISSEGGLFEYGSDADIVANLQVITERASGDTCVAGSVTRGDGPGRAAQAATNIRVIPRSLEQFGALAAGAGWRIDRAITRPFSFDVRLRRKEETGLLVAAGRPSSPGPS
ncbi:MAG: hypothetical protein ABI634_02450 [Acidobacteriota bacterium]